MSSSAVAKRPIHRPSDTIPSAVRVSTPAQATRPADKIGEAGLACERCDFPLEHRDPGIDQIEGVHVVVEGGPGGPALRDAPARASGDG